MDSLLKEEAEKLGLQAVGATGADGYVKEFYPWARSVVTVAMSYLPSESDTASRAGCGMVARFARSADYHHVLAEKLCALAELLKTRFGVLKMDICVDTSPLSERRLAAAAGIGWLGKNCCLYVEDCGSYVALGEVVVDVVLDYDARSQDSRCGGCRLCLDACPTGALTAPFRLNRERCISYLTQRGGCIPVELRAAMGNRIYGCDVCQEVCPHNADVKSTNPEFEREMFPGAYPELIMLLRLDKSTFYDKVKPSSIGWIGRSRIRRNAAVAAGNLRMREAVPVLREMLSDPSPIVRAHASWAIEQIQ